jgi:hypothetical protein
MRLSRIAILAIRGASPGIVKKLAEAIGASDPSIYRYINDNDDNLTKAAALKVIREETGLSDGEILEEDEPVAAGK